MYVCMCIVYTSLSHSLTHLGMQLGGVRSTSQAAKSFIGTGFCPLLVVILLPPPMPPAPKPAAVAEAEDDDVALPAADAEPLPGPPQPPPPPPLLVTNLSINLDDLSTIFMVDLFSWTCVVFFCILCIWFDLLLCGGC